MDLPTFLMRIDLLDTFILVRYGLIALLKFIINTSTSFLDNLTMWLYNIGTINFSLDSILQTMLRVEVNNITYVIKVGNILHGKADT